MGPGETPRRTGLCVRAGMTRALFVSNYALRPAAAAERNLATPYPYHPNPPPPTSRPERTLCHRPPSRQLDVLLAHTDLDHLNVSLARAVCTSN